MNVVVVSAWPKLFCVAVDVLSLCKPDVEPSNWGYTSSASKEKALEGVELVKWEGKKIKETKTARKEKMDQLQQ